MKRPTEVTQNSIISAAFYAFSFIVFSLFVVSLLVLTGCDNKEKVLDVETPGGQLEIERDRDTGEVDIKIQKEGDEEEAETYDNETEGN